MSKFHVEFDIDDSGEYEEGEEHTATPDDMKEAIVSVLTDGYAFEISDIKIQKL